MQCMHSVKIVVGNCSEQDLVATIPLSWLQTQLCLGNICTISVDKSCLNDFCSTT